MNSDTLYDMQKEKWGMLATWWWVIAGVYFYVATPGYSLFSLRAVLFIVGGMFAAALVFGMLFYALQRATAVVLEKTLPVKAVLQGDVVPLFGWLLRFGQIAAVLLTARWLFYRFG
jgi:hypothetical protein